MPAVRLRLLLATLLALATLATPALAAPRHLVLVASEYPPYTSEGLAHGGPMSEITVTALRKAGYEVQVRFLPWARALRLAEQGLVDGLLAVWRSPARERVFLFSEPVIANRIMLCGRDGAMPVRYEGPAMLRRYTVGVVRGYANPPALEESGARLEPVTDDLQNLRKLVAGRVDLIVIDGRVQRYLVGRHLPEAGVHIRCLQPPLQEPPLHLVVARSVPGASEVVQAFDTQLELLLQSGEYARIAAQWQF